MTDTRAIAKERPILMCGEMIRAVLSGQKTQTRRIIDLLKSLSKEQRSVGFTFNAEFATAGDLSWLSEIGGSNGADLKKCQQLNVPMRHPEDAAMPWDDCGRTRLYCPHGEPGERLWVKETFQHTDGWYPVEKTPWKNCIRGDKATWVDYAATYKPEKGEERYFPWKPSIFMPRWASRITLEIQSIRVERVQDISEDDARAEGGSIKCKYVGNRCNSNRCAAHHYRRGFEALWDSINAKRGFGWQANPWVWVVEFKRIKP